MKVVTLAGALDAHAITPATTFYDPGYTGVGGYTIHDWDLKNHGTVTMANVLLRSYDKWHDSEFATASFGQGIQVNMLQMLAAVNVAANGGKYAPPHLVERIGGVPNPLTQRPQRQVISAESARLMTQMMM